MTVITDPSHKVVSVSLIPGLLDVPHGYHVYFPAKCKTIPATGEFYIESDWVWPVPSVPPHLPVGPASFGAVRKYDVHCGVDIHCEAGDTVVAVEDGLVVLSEIFTGPYASPPTPWWRTTCALYVEGVSGVVVYGEINPMVYPGSRVEAGQIIGTVQRVLINDKGTPTSMLHLELHTQGTRNASTWNIGGSMPLSLLDPTPYL